MSASTERLFRERLAEGTLGRGFGALAWHAIAAVVAWTERRRERRHLAELDDRLLKDIGLSRSDVECEVAKPFWQP